MEPRRVCWVSMMAEELLLFVQPALSSLVEECFYLFLANAIAQLLAASSVYDLLGLPVIKPS